MYHCVCVSGGVLVRVGACWCVFMRAGVGVVGGVGAVVCACAQTFDWMCVCVRVWFVRTDMNGVVRYTAMPRRRAVLCTQIARTPVGLWRAACVVCVPE